MRVIRFKVELGINKGFDSDNNKNVRVKITSNLREWNSYHDALVSFLEEIGIPYTV